MDIQDEYLEILPWNNHLIYSVVKFEILNSAYVKIHRKKLYQHKKTIFLIYENLFVITKKCLVNKNIHFFQINYVIESFGLVI